jgi:hypothetical protein
MKKLNTTRGTKPNPWKATKTKRKEQKEEEKEKKTKKSET